MVYQAAEAKGEMVTVVLRLVVVFLTLEKNTDAVIGILENSLGMTGETKRFVESVLKTFAECLADTHLGMDLALATIYYIFFGADSGVDTGKTGYDDLNDAWLAALAELRKESDVAADLIEDILNLDIFKDVLTPDGIAPNGLIKFFQTIIEWFRGFIEWFRNAF